MWSRRRTPDPRPADAAGRRKKPAEDRLLALERLLARGRFDQAVRQALDLVAESSGDLSRLNRIGDLLARADHLHFAVALFERVGRAYAADGFWAKAIAIYKKILRLDPRRSDVRTKLAFLYQQSGLPTGAGARP